MGEFELLARIRERLPAGDPRIHLGSGDDAAVTVPEGATATSVDALVEGVHFRRQHATFAQIGHKALATALSDLAAMGADPGESYVVLGLPPDLDEDDCIALLDGILALAAATGTSLVGGDVTRAEELFLAVTVVGHAAAPTSFVSRAGAKPGDALVLTGEIGGAAGGLALLENPAFEPLLAAAPALRRRQVEPRPRLGAGRALAHAGATAMIDLSDGLGGDARQLAESSGVALRIDAGAIPFAPGSKESMVATGRDPWELLRGGEDYELLASLPPGQAEAATEAVRVAEGIALTKIGEVLAGSGVEIRLPGGRRAEPGGFDQLA
ncbi:MAG TPA: thiamine-phosphate kinase [Solirubrobacterales bacterium]